jgi:hypothetical protein
MTKHIVSVFGAPLTGKTHISHELAGVIPSAVRYGSYDEVKRPFALERAGDITRVYKDIGALLAENDVVVVDEDPVSMAAMQAFRLDSFMGHGRSAAHEYYHKAATANLSLTDVAYANLHVSVAGDDLGERLGALEARVAPGNSISHIGQIAFVNDVVPLLEAGNEYEHHLRLAGDTVALVETNEAYDINEVARQLGL